MLKMSIQSSSSRSLIHHVLSCNTLFEDAHTLILSHSFIGVVTLARNHPFVDILGSRSDGRHHVWNPVITTLVLVLELVCHPLRPVHKFLFWDLCPRKSSN